MNSCWLTLFLSMMIEILLTFVTTTNPVKHMVGSIIVPSALMFAVMIVAESAVRLFVKVHDFINIITALALASILIWVHVSVPPIHGMLFLPFIISMFYFS
ncbi:hypothetical protein PAECIP111802_02616 [Paenibacillus allorhizosphaerae]|uniref:Uncharacterized protein n=2 Tax=Paenibacillus allorhizosphaerae TaxID=2849866 RepID=A0ABN7TJR5_9BACL|nr:hypothetical protein PAECIP111802_02616 [Paenibacillus allorhizosphaerae]